MSQILSFNDYQKQALVTAVYAKKDGLMYTTLGLCGEAGECANRVKKVFRDKSGVLDENTREGVMDELSDVLWYCAALATELGYDLEDVAKHNLAKLAARKARGTLQGSGDSR